MSIKIRFTKKATLIIGGVIVCGLIGLGCWNNSTSKMRQTLKDGCRSNCDCFRNIIDYRLTNEQVRVFVRFSDELQTRRDVSILEFATPEQAADLQRIFAVCQPKVAPQPKAVVQQPTPASKQVEQEPIAQPKKKKK